MTFQIARKVGCWRSDEEEMLTCLRMSDPVGLTLAGKIDVLLLLGKGQSSSVGVAPAGAGPCSWCLSDLAPPS